MKQNKKVTLLMGLPGSGKTTYAKSLCDSQYARQYRPYRLDADSICEGNTDARIAKFVLDRFEVADHVILDGLFLKRGDAVAVLGCIRDIATMRVNVEFEIVWREPDREACLHNDIGRRDLSSRNTILNAIFEPPNANLLKMFNATEVRMQVVRKPASAVWIDQNVEPYTKRLESEDWSLGDTYGSYDGVQSTRDADTPPDSFKQFDELLEKVCQQITFLQYRKVYAACVSIEKRSESDYYGGTMNYARFVCDLVKLYEMLRQLKLIQETPDVAVQPDEPS